MNIKMISDCKGSNDGTRVRLYMKGISYSVPEDMTEQLAETFVKIGVAKHQPKGRPMREEVKGMETMSIKPHEKSQPNHLGSKKKK